MEEIFCTMASKCIVDTDTVTIKIGSGWLRLDGMSFKVPVCAGNEVRALGKFPGPKQLCPS